MQRSRWQLQLVGIVLTGLLAGGIAALSRNAVRAHAAAQEPKEEASAKKLPIPESPFRGKIGQTYKDSKPDFPKVVRPPKGAPNVLLVLLDDIGFGHASVFGGPVATPNLDKLAKRSLKYNHFHTTALCSPTRAALLSGRNHHSVGMGTITELATGFPGYNSSIPRSCASIAEILRYYGYLTAAFGKWHQTPDWETGPAGPYDRWPSGQGFDFSFGFMGGETSQYTPQLYQNNLPVEPSKTAAEGYHLTNDLATRSIEWMRKQNSEAPDRPFFLYFATGALHAPHHAPKEWIEKYKGKFDHGWDVEREKTLERQINLGVVPKGTKLTPRPKEIPAWDSLKADEKKLFARMQEVFAGFAAHTDHEVGRLLDTLDELKIADNTLVIFIVGDNGPSAEGTLNGTLNNMASQQGVMADVAHMLKEIDSIGTLKHENHYPVGWAWAGSAPFQWLKQVASHFGGTRNPMLIAWPKGIPAKHKGALCSQFHHVIDIAPTILEAAGLKAPKEVNGITQKSMDGISLAYTFKEPDAPGRRKTQYFEMMGNRAIYHDGWVAAARHGRLPWITLGGSKDFDKDVWELYDIRNDFSQADDLAAKNPKKLKELQALFLAEAKKFNVLPLDDRFGDRADASDRPSVLGDRKSITYYPGAFRIPEGSAPNEKAGSHRITAKVTLQKKGADGILATSGGSSGGYALYVQDGKLVYEYNYFADKLFRITSTTPLPAGEVEVAMEYRAKDKSPGAGGTATLFVAGKKAGSIAVEKRIPFRNSATETFDVGLDTGTPVSVNYSVPFGFSGTLHWLRFEYLD